MIDVIAERSSRRDFARLLAPPAKDIPPIVAEAERLRKRLAIIDADYDNGDIDAKRWRTAKQRVKAELTEVDKQLAARPGARRSARWRGHPTRPRRSVRRR